MYEDYFLPVITQKMKWFELAIVVACTVVVVFAEKIRYDDYRVYYADVENDEQLRALHELETNPDGIVFLEPPTDIGHSVELLVAPHKFDDIANLFKTHAIQNRIKTSNFQA